MQLDIRIESHYGRDLYYPANELGMQFAKLMRCKTFTAEQLRIIFRMKIAIHVIDKTRRAQLLTRELLRA